MNISNLLTASAAVTIAVAGTIYGRVDTPAVNYYIVTPAGCQAYNLPPGCGPTVTSTPCKVFLSEFGTDCIVKKESPLAPCAITMYRQ